MSMLLTKDATCANAHRHTFKDDKGDRASKYQAHHGHIQLQNENSGLINVPLEETGMKNPNV